MNTRNRQQLLQRSDDLRLQLARECGRWRPLFEAADDGIRVARLLAPLFRTAGRASVVRDGIPGTGRWMAWLIAVKPWLRALGLIFSTRPAVRIESTHEPFHQP